MSEDYGNQPRFIYKGKEPTREEFARIVSVTNWNRCCEQAAQIVMEEGGSTTAYSRILALRINEVAPTS